MAAKSGVSDPIAEPHYGYQRTPPDLPPGMFVQTNDVRPGTTGSNEMKVPETLPENASRGGEPGGVGSSGDGTQKSGGAASDAWAQQKARDLYINGRNYMDANITLGWERNLFHFRSEHGPSTPYTRRDWKRARTFRPKTRANVKAQEAAHAAAAFATQDYMAITAVDPTNENEVISAAVNKAILQKRLELVPWNWFMTCQGAWQDTKTYGICASHQYWRYERVEEVVPKFDDQGKPILGMDSEGRETPLGKKETRTLYDMPVVDLIPPECILFDPMCDWRNPAQTSPGIVYLCGMHVGEVMQRMDTADSKTGQMLWRKHEIGEILSASRELIDNRTRRAREGHHRVDPTLERSSEEFTMVWPHFNIAREGGVDVAWWTLGTELILTDPVPLTQLYPWLQAGERPFQIGFSTIEAHRNYPDGDVAQIASLQEEINAVANQRLDNVRLVLNKRYFIRRGSQMDLDALMRNVPGGGVMTNDPEKDVQVIQTPDVTSSAYQEQDRLAQDLDDLVGGFGQASIAAGGKQMDRAGSMDVLQGAAGAVQDYGIKIFFSTWMEPVLRQLVRMEQMYETDMFVLATAARNTALWQKFGTDVVTDELLMQNLTVCINVGMGNTDPVKRVQKLTFGVSQVAQLPDMARRMKSMEIANEIFGSLGYKDATRFFMNDQELTEHMKTTPPPPPPPEVAVKMQEIQQHAETEKMRHERETTSMNLDHEWRMKQVSSAEEQAHLHNMTQEEIAKMKDKTLRDIGAAKEGNRLAEVNLKRADSAHERVANARQQAVEATKPKPKPEGGEAKKPAKAEAPKEEKGGDDAWTQHLLSEHQKLVGEHQKLQGAHQKLQGEHQKARQELEEARKKPAPKKRTGKAKLPSGGEMTFELEDHE